MWFEFSMKGPFRYIDFSISTIFMKRMVFHWFSNVLVISSDALTPFILADLMPIYFVVKLANTWLIPILCHRCIVYTPLIIYFYCCLYALYISSYHTKINHNNHHLKTLLKGSYPFIWANNLFLLNNLYFCNGLYHPLCCN